MNESLRRKLIFAIARDSPADIVAWAGEALDAGMDSKALRILAGLEDESEARDYLERASSEIGFELPSRLRCLELAARYIAGDIVNGEVTPQDGCASIYDLYVAGGWLPSLERWTGLDDMLSLAREGIYGTVQEAEAAIVEEAKRMLERDAE